MKKHLKWIIPACAVVLVAAAALLALFLGLGSSNEPAQPDVIVGWNVDKEQYWDQTLKASLRMKGGENYRVRFAVDGEQVDYFVTDYQMLNMIDSQKFVGLRVDENNVVTEVLKPHKVGGGLAVYQYYIVEIQDGLLICNNVASGKGLPLKLKINDNTQVYDVGGEGLLVGLPTQLQVGCQIYGVYGTDGYVSHIFSMPPFEPEPVYWNVTRMYNSSTKSTTRERDVTGFFTFEFVVDGEAVTLRTRDIDIASKVDSFSAKCMHLEFDEEGLISDAIHAKYSTGGSSMASWYHVLRIDSVDSGDIEVVSNGFYAEKFSGKDKGSTAECTLADNVKIYDMTGRGAYIGQPTELRLYDQVHCLTNPYGDVCIIFVVSRPVEAELYYNLERKWNDNTKTSTRAKAGDGYYYFDMSVNGKQVRLKTADESIVKTIDGRAAKVLGLELDGDVITGAFTPSQVSGSNKTVFDYCEVVKIDEDGTVTANRKGQDYVGVITENTEVYNVSSVASQKGEPTTIRVGDKLYGFADFEGNVTTVYVVSRQMPGPVYWNLDRSYDSAKQVTKRQPAEDGYYYLKFFDGKNTVTYKTNSKSLVSKIDSMVAVALTRNGDVITGAAKYDTVKGFTGGGFASWYTVKSVNGSTVTAGNSTKTVSGIMAYGCPIYNVSGGSSVPVTKTSLKVGDKIHGIKNAEGQVAAIYVVERTVDVELYYNLERKWDSENAITTRVPDENGWYWFTMSVNAEHVTLKTKDLALANAIDERSARVLGLEVKGDEILAVYKPGVVKASKSTVFDYAVVTAVSEDGVITATRNDKTFTGTLAKDAKIFNVSSTAAKVGQFTTVEVGDTVYGLGTGSKQVNYIFVTSRQNHAQLYYNINRLWDSSNSKSVREADADGWYWFDMVFDGKQVKLKTQDAAIVKAIDERAAKVLGLEVEDGVITAAYKPSQVTGSENTLFDFAKVTAIAADGTITATKSDKTVTGKPGSNCKIYNVSKSAAVIGEAGQIQVGDTIYGLADSKKNLTVIYITGREVKLDLYYNITRMWDSEAGKSTREADADGWYWFNMVLDTKQVKLKTQDAAIVKAIDERAAKVLGLEVKDGVITAAYKPSQVTGSENTLLDFAKVTAIAADGTITAVKSNQTVMVKPDSNCKIYDVDIYAQSVGQISSVKVGDTLYGLADSKSNLTYIYITKRTYEITAPCAACGQTQNWIMWDGASKLTDGHWYVHQDVQIGDCAVIAKDTTVCLNLNGKTVSGDAALDRMFNVYGVFNLMDQAGNGKVIANYNNPTGKTGSVFYVQNSANSGVGEMNLYSGTLTATGTTKSGGIGGVDAAFTMYGGTICDGSAADGTGIVLSNTSAAQMKLLGGSITGSTVYARKALTVGGAVVIQDVYLLEGRTLTVDGLTNGASIGVTLAETYGTFATGAVEADKDHFKLAEGLTAEYADGALSIPDPNAIPAPEVHTDHCICGGLGNVGDHTCLAENPTWEVWDGTWESGKYYCLTEDFEVKSTIRIEEGQTLHLCLNGHDLMGAANVTRIFNIYGVLNLCDHADDAGNYAGDVISNYDIAGGNTQTGRVFYVQNKENAAFNMFGGNLKANSATNKGGIGGSAKALRIYAGTISGGNALECGGNLQIDGGSLTVYGGSISGGTSADGSNIYINSGTVKILGGQISDGKVYVSDRPAVTVGGAARIEAVYLTSGRTLEVQGLVQGASIGVILEDTYGAFATGAVEADKAYFTVAEGLTVEFADGTLSIPDPNAPAEPEGHKDHCICGGLGNVGDHTCAAENPVWEPWTGTWESGKYYYLTEDYELTDTIKLSDDQTLNLCLNGHDIIGGTSVTRMFNIFGVLNLCDHADDAGNYAGDVISNYDTAGGNTQTGRVFYVQTRDDGALNQFGGNLKSNSSTKNGGIGGVCAAYRLYAGTVSDGKATEKGGNLMLESGKAHAIIYGGTITGGVATDGGNVYIKGSGKLTVDGGTITGGLDKGVKNANNGGNAYVEKGTLNLVSGTISGGYTSNAGGSIRVQGDGTLNISGGILTGGYAKGNGGNVYSQGTINVTGGTISDGAVASGKIGGNLYASSGSLNISDDPALEGKPAITGGTATTGGNIAIKVDASIADCTISGGTADTGADVYFEKSGGTLTLGGQLDVTVYVKSGSVDDTQLNEESHVTVEP